MYNLMPSYSSSFTSQYEMYKIARLFLYKKAAAGRITLINAVSHPWRAVNMRFRLAA